MEITDKISLAIDLAVSMIRTAKFIGIDEESQDALESFVSSLDDEERSELSEKESFSDLKSISSFFDKGAHEASHVVFEIELSGKSKDSFDLNSILVTGPVKKTRILEGEIIERDSVIDPVLQVFYVISEIDHDLVNLIEKHSHRMGAATMDFAINTPSRCNIKKKKFI